MPEVQAGEVTPIEAVEPVVTEPAAVAEDQKTEEVAETTEQQEERKQSKFQRRLERQKTARVAAETETRMLREQLARLEEQRKPQPSGEPKREDFAGDDIGYLDARAKWHAKQEASEVVRNDRAQADSREKQKQQSTDDTKLAESWAKREKAFQAKTSDYEDVVMPFIEESMDSFSKDARRFIADAGPEMLYHLGKNEAEAERIANLSPVRQLAELGKLEDKLTVPAKKVSSAPAPANHVNSTATGSKDPSKMNQDEYRAWMKANGSRFVR